MNKNGCKYFAMHNTFCQYLYVAHSVPSFIMQLNLHLMPLTGSIHLTYILMYNKSHILYTANTR